MIMRTVNNSQSGVLTTTDLSVRFPSAGDGNLGSYSLSINFGGDTPHNNMSPGMAAYLWKRTA